MNTDNNKDFDFDDWAGLFKENPEEFEARRQATLMIELAKAEPTKAEAARSLLEAYERRVDGADSSKRFVEAARMMNESLLQLQTELMVLRQALIDEAEGNPAASLEVNQKETVDLPNNILPFKLTE